MVTLLARSFEVELAVPDSELHWGHGDGLVLRGLSAEAGRTRREDRRRRAEEEKKVSERELLTLYAIAFRLNSTLGFGKVMKDLLAQPKAWNRFWKQPSPLTLKKNPP